MMYQQAHTLTLVKEVTNDDGGNATVANFPLYYDGTSATSGQANTVAPGTYTLTEDSLSGYTSSAWVCTGAGTQNGSDITLTLGQSATCTITNDDDAPTLKLVKAVANDNGGNGVADDWTLYATGDGGFDNLGGSGVAETVLANEDYVLSESTVAGYSASSWSCTDGDNDGTVNLGEGEDVVCTITNDDDAPTLKLVKAVANDNGGNGVADDWTLYATGDGGFDNLGGSGVAETVLANEDYVLSESTVAGYSASSWSCTDGDNDGTVNLGEGEDVVCTITNDDDAPTITLIKNVVGGSAGENDFGISIDDTTVESNVATEVDANTPIVLDEEGLGGNTFTSLEGYEQYPTEP